MNSQEENNSLQENMENNTIPEDNKELIDYSVNNEIKTESIEDYNFGWNRYSERTNGRFAMLGFLAIIIIEIISKSSFLNWSGILK